MTTEKQWPALKIGDRVIHLLRQEREIGIVTAFDDDGDPVCRFGDEAPAAQYYSDGIHHVEPVRVDASPAAKPTPTGIDDPLAVVNSNFVDVYDYNGGFDVEGGAAPCPHCSAWLPLSLVEQINSGTDDCPSCGWREGRCKYKGCNGWVIAQYRGKPRCIKCHNEQALETRAGRE